MLKLGTVKNCIPVNPGDRDLKSSLGDLFFALGIFCEFAVSFTGYLFGGYYEQTIILTGMVFFCIKILLSLDIKKDWLICAFLAVIGLLCFKDQNSALVMRMFLIFLAGRDQKSKSVIKFFFYGTALVMVVAAILSFLGIYNTASITDIYRNFKETRYSFGFIHPNSFAFFWFRLITMFLYLYGEKLKWWGYMLTAGVYLFIAYLSSSKICMAAGLAALVLTVFARLCKSELMLKVYYILGNLMITGIAGFSYVAMVFYFAYYNKKGKPIRFWEPINVKLFTGRLKGAHDLYASTPFNLFGMDKNIVSTEMGFVSSLFSHGIVFVIIYVLILYVLFYRLYKMKDRMGMTMVLAGTAYALAESFLPYVNKNPALMAGVGAALTTQIYFEKKKKENTIINENSNKKRIKLGFTDMWGDFIPENNIFVNALKNDFEIELSDDPDYLICSCFGQEHHKYRDAIKILFVGENMVPDFNLYDYAIGFHYIDFDDRYLRLPLYALYDHIIDKALNKHTFSDEHYLAKKGYCCCVISNPDGAPVRDQVITALGQYKPVSSGGRYRNNVGGPVEDKLKFTSDYRISLAIENSSQPGYTTEKLLEAFAAGTVPVYWGSCRIKEEFNEEAFIDVSDYHDYDSLLARVKEVYENDELYLSMVKAPIYKDGSMCQEYFKESYIRDFLYPVFNCEKQEAYRRNMVYYGRKYQNEMRDAWQIMGIAGLYKKAQHTISKKWKQISTKKGK